MKYFYLAKTTGCLVSFWTLNLNINEYILTTFSINVTLFVRDVTFQTVVEVHNAFISDTEYKINFVWPLLSNCHDIVTFWTMQSKIVKSDLKKSYSCDAMNKKSGLE